jgi:transposase
MRSQGCASDRLRRRLASEVLRDVRTLDRKIAELNMRVEAEVDASRTSLTEIFGVGPILAATILGTVGDVARFPSKAHFASSTQAQRRWRLQAARWCATGSRWAGTAS